MTHLTIIISVLWLGGLGAGVYLVVAGHPWFAGIVLLMTFVLVAVMRYNESDKKNEKAEGAGE